MKRNHTLLAFCGSIILGTVLIYGCGDDDTSNPGTSSGTVGTDSGKTDTGTSSSSSSSSSSGSSEAGTDSGPPKPPAAPALLGKQIDRFGRPAINTAGNGTFEADASTAGAAKDEYNANGDKATWSKYRDTIAANLAIYDSVDSTNAVSGCGNQPFADASAANTTATSRYGTLAGVLADDRQWMNTGGTVPATDDENQYLYVELNATSVFPNTNVGGRKLTFDVIDRTYGVVSGVQPTGAGFPDNISRGPTKTQGTTFPYLVAP